MGAFQAQGRLLVPENWVLLPGLVGMGKPLGGGCSPPGSKTAKWDGGFLSVA